MEALYLSHAHIDHTRAAAAVMERYRVRNAITNGFETGSGRFGQIAVHRRVAAAEESAATQDDINLATVWTKDIPRDRGLRNAVIDPVACAGVDPVLSVFWGRVDQPGTWKPEAFRNQNNHSVVLHMRFGTSTMLLAGDLEEEGIASMVKHFNDARLLNVDVLQASHHGSHNGTAPELLEKTTPDIAVIQMGRTEREMAFTAWAYGHPRKVLMDRLQDNVRMTRHPASVMVATGAKQFGTYQLTKAVYGTGWDGTLVLEADAHGNWTVLQDVPQQAALIDLNTATLEQLQTLPMIGPARAAAIIKLRRQRGRLRSVDELALIPGIKAGTIGAIKHHVVTP